MSPHSAVSVVSATPCPLLAQQPGDHESPPAPEAASFLPVSLHYFHES